MKNEFNPYILDDEHAWDVNHSRYELGEGKIREMQDDISARRKRSRAMLEELGIEVKTRDAKYYEREVNARIEYSSRKEEYDAFLAEYLKVLTPEQIFAALERHFPST